MSYVLSKDKRVQLVSCLVEGMSLRATSRICGVAFNTVLKFVPWVGEACSDYQDRTMVNLPCKRLQADEIWAFCHAKDKNLPKHLQGAYGFGSVWTWTAICDETRLMPTWFVGDRSANSALLFLTDLKARLKHRVQFTTDGLHSYISAVETAFGADIDFAQLVKLYNETPGNSAPEARYSPGVCIGAKKVKLTGNPDMEHVSTSYAERANLTIRMGNRRFTRLTNAFSKKVENHAHAFALFAMHYNFCRIHQTLRCTPAMAAGVTSSLWEIGDIVDLMPACPAEAAA